MTALQKMNDYGKNGIPFLFVLDYELQNPIVLKLSEVEQAGIRFNFNGISGGIGENFTSVPKKQPDLFRKSTSVPISGQSNSPLSPIISSNPISFEDYLRSFNIIQHHLQAGNAYLTNLTFSTEIQLDLSLQSVYEQSQAKYKLSIRDNLVVFSPEIFVQIKAGVISTFPMKGTIDATLPNAKEIILNDEKELAEHITVVDLLRNDLSRVASSVRVNRFRYIDKITTNQGSLLQVSSEISGYLAEDWHSRLGEIIFNLLPAGSITGAPKKRVQEIITEAEIEPRGFYTGVCGLFDGENLDSGVMIRYIEQRDNRFYYRSGGGITMDSDPAQEYQELKDKIYIPLGTEVKKS